ncbi:MAG: Asp-tRNA(Asn)/Glu-tRNA(Gln) amidotransferase subunit GatC [Phycisphaeraceae bacterium]|nr:MAG: Asp-tRNA(Asn)/Glu-tRNA(Gln) amidotransferase subunit GatC [Phycisphaeraceae bacterium]
MSDTKKPQGAELSEDVVRRVAHLSRLALDDASIERHRGQLVSILGYIDRLRELDTENVDPMAHPLDVVNRLDADEPRACLSNEALMKMAPQAAAPFVRVPKVLGGGEGA